MELKVLILAMLGTLQVQESRSSDLWREVRANSNEVNYTEALESHERVLSRRKRFLTFPDGSSLQLVFCCQTAAMIWIGDIFLYSSTAALAWTLPKDPDFIRMFKSDGQYAQDAQRREDKKHIYYIGSKGEVLARVPYRRKTLVNPAFAKRSVDSKPSPKPSINKTAMHAKQEKRDYLNLEFLEDSRIEFHRRSRVALFWKLEVLFRALGQGNGRHCVLRQICETQRVGPQSSFLDEIRRVIFTLPKGRSYDEEMRDYDAAHLPTEFCSQLYTGCNNIQFIN